MDDKGSQYTGPLFRVTWLDRYRRTEMVIGDIEADDNCYLPVHAVCRCRQRLCHVGKRLHFIAIEKRCQTISCRVGSPFCQRREINRRRRTKWQPGPSITQELENGRWINRPEKREPRLANLQVFAKLRSDGFGIEFLGQY